MSLAIENRKAHHDYEVLETLEAGLELKGYEVKSLREGRANLRDGFARIDQDGQLYLYNVHISPYQAHIPFRLDPYRPRKLLVKKAELKKLVGKTKEKGLTLVPLRIYFNKRGFAKVLLALAKGRRKVDKRQKLKQEADRREIERVMKYGKFLLLVAFAIIGCGPKKKPPSQVQPGEVSQVKETSRTKTSDEVKVFYLDRQGELKGLSEKKPENLLSLFSMMRRKPRGLTSALPEDLVVLEVRRKGATAFVNLKGDSLSYPPAGGFEALWVKAVVFTLTSLPEIQKVQFLVDGRRINALPSGLDIKGALSRSSFQ